MNNVSSDVSCSITIQELNAVECKMMKIRIMEVFYTDLYSNSFLQNHSYAGNLPTLSQI